MMERFTFFAGLLLLACLLLSPVDLRAQTWQ